MARKYKVVQCPTCKEYTYIPIGAHRNFCPRCNAKVALHELDGQVVKSFQSAQRLVQNHQYAVHGMAKPSRIDENHQQTKQVLQILRSQRLGTPQWCPLHELFQQCMKAGLRPQEIQQAIEFLNAKGFLEKREDTIRAIPLN